MAFVRVSFVYRSLAHAGFASPPFPFSVVILLVVLSDNITYDDNATADDHDDEVHDDDHDHDHDDHDHDEESDGTGSESVSGAAGFHIVAAVGLLSGWLLLAVFAM
jgi:hypothetical protein